nr:hypothetical protein [Tanacetum cinerariifolium]
EIDDPDISIEEYILLEAEKAHRRDQEFNWKTATYDKVKYFLDINYIKDLENEFPTIVYKDALTSEPEVSSVPMVLVMSKRMLINLIKNLYVSFGVPFDPKLFYKDGMKLETSLT